MLGKITFLACGLLSLSAVACSSSSGTADAPLTSIAADKDIATISDTEASQFCTDTRAYAKAQISDDDAHRISCNLGGAISAAFAAGASGTPDPAVCKQSANDCLGKPFTPTSPDPKECAGKKPPTGCKGLTVGEYSACVKEQVAQLEQDTNLDFVCSNVANKSAQPSPACDIVKTKCGGKTP